MNAITDERLSDVVHKSVDGGLYINWLSSREQKDLCSELIERRQADKREVRDCHNCFDNGDLCHCKENRRLNVACSYWRVDDVTSVPVNSVGYAHATDCAINMNPRHACSCGVEKPVKAEAPCDRVHGIYGKCVLAKKHITPHSDGKGARWEDYQCLRNEAAKQPASEKPLADVPIEQFESWARRQIDKAFALLKEQSNRIAQLEAKVAGKQL